MQRKETNPKVGMGQAEEYTPPKPLWRFGWTGWTLVPIVLGLALVLILGLDGRYYFLRAIQWLFGTDAMMWAVTTGLSFHSLDSLAVFGSVPPSARFGLLALCVTLFGLGVHPRRFGIGTYLAVFALGIAVIPLETQGGVWMMRAGQGAGSFATPGSWRFLQPFVISTVAAGLLTACVFWFITRSRLISLYLAVTIGIGAWLHAEATAAIYGSRLLLVPAAAQLADAALRWVWHPALLALLLWWSVRARRRWPPPWACRFCGYDLRGCESELCPECGAKGTNQLRRASAD